MKHKNPAYMFICYFFFFLFAGMILYFLYFQVARSESFINNSHNPLVSLFSEHVVRGEIRSADGEILAITETDDEGNETRKYPQKKTFAHVVGYTTQGTTGLENALNFTLLRSHESLGQRIMDVISDQKTKGDHVITTLDSKLQKVAYDALGSKEGAVVVMDPESGEVLAMVSKPDFNPNRLEKDWDQLNEEGSSALFHRATQGRYTPGSTFKILTALAYYRKNPTCLSTFTYNCQGQIQVGDYTIHCSGQTAHGEQTLEEAFANSCNCAFAWMGLQLKKTQLQDTCEDLLFNQELSFELQTSVSSVSLTQKEDQEMKAATAIGQGRTLVSPFYMCMLMCACANDGVLMQPYLTDEVVNEQEVRVRKTQPQEQESLLTSAECAFLRQLMRYAVTDGTASKLDVSAYTAYGKTGTAEVATGSDETNAWFVGYAEADGKKLAVAVVVENSGSGSKYAVPIARKLFDHYFQ